MREKKLKSFLLIAFFLFNIISCKNFFNGSEILSELIDAIEFQNLPYTEITITSDKNATESIFPAANIYSKDYKKGQKLNLSFSADDEYQFVYWQCFPENSVEFKNKNNLETEATIISDDAKITIKPLTYIRPTVTISPDNKQEVPKNSPIIITFSKPLNIKQNQLSSIKITSDGIDFSSYFNEPKISEDNTQITILSKTLMNVTGTKTITVTIPKDFAYKADDNEQIDIKLGKDFSYSYLVNNQTVEKVQLNFKNNVIEGELNISGLHEYYLNDEVHLFFTPNGKYKIKKWEIIDENNNPVPESIIQQTFSNNNHEITLKILAAISGPVTVRPYCSLIPEIENYSPQKANNETVTQNSSIIINFNKPMNADDINFENIKIQNNTLNINNKFELPKLSDDGKILTITKKRDSKNFLIDPKDTTTILTISVTLTNIHEAVNYGETAEKLPDFTFNYSVNNTVDITGPGNFKIELFKDKEYKIPINNQTEDKWEDSDFDLNHLNRVYAKVSGEDKDSGVYSLKSTATLVKNVKGERVALNPDYYSYFENKFNYINNEFYSEGIIELDKNKTDGLYELKFSLIDYVGNSSDTISYYIIKDTSLDDSVLIAEEFRPGRIAGCKGEEVNEILRVSKEDTSFSSGYRDDVRMTFIGEETYYENHKSKPTIEVTWGYSNDNINYEALKTNETFCFSRDAFKDTYIKIKATDDVENQIEIIRVIPAQLDLCYSGKIFGDGGNQFQPYYSNKQVLEHCPELYNANDFISYLVAKSNKSSKYGLVGWKTSLYKYSLDSSSGTDKSAKYLYCIPNLQYQNGDYFGTVSNSFVEIDRETETNDEKFAYIKQKTFNYSNFPEQLKVISDEAVNGAGYRNITFSLPDNYYFDKKYDFFVKATQKSSNQNDSEIDTTVFGKRNELAIKVVSNNYDYYIMLYSEEEGIALSEILYSDENDGKDNIPPNLGNKNYRPLFINGASNYARLSFHGKETETRGWPIDTDVYTNKEGKGEIEYYFIPISEQKLVENTYTISQLRNSSYEKRTATYNINDIKRDVKQKKTCSTPPPNEYTGGTLSQNLESKIQAFIELPIGDIAEGYYTICVIAKDNNLNESILCFPFSNIYDYNRDINQSFSINNENLFNFTGITDGKCTIQYYEPEQKRWLNLIFTNYSSSSRDYWTYDSYEGYNLSDATFTDDKSFIEDSNYGNKIIRVVPCYSNISDNTAYFFTPVYFVPKYKKNPELKIQKKFFLQQGNSIMVFCDGPVLVHTYYSSKNLNDFYTDDEDVKTWYSRGIEITGENTVVTEYSSDFSYDIPFDKVPSGNYYTTIVHFADGTAKMTDPILKK